MILSLDSKRWSIAGLSSSSYHPQWQLVRRRGRGEGVLPHLLSFSSSLTPSPFPSPPPHPLGEREARSRTPASVAWGHICALFPLLLLPFLALLPFPSFSCPSPYPTRLPFNPFFALKEENDDDVSPYGRWKCKCPAGSEHHVPYTKARWGLLIQRTNI